MLVVPSRAQYTIENGQQRGATFDAGKAFEAFINSQLTAGTEPVKVVFIPVRNDALVGDLKAGHGDIAANLLFTFERDDQVAFSEPVRKGVRELIVTGPGAPPIVSLEDVAGRSIHVRRSSDHYASLVRLNEQLAKVDKPVCKIVIADESQTDEDLLEQVNAGTIPATLLDDYLYEELRAQFGKVAVNEDVAVSQDGVVAWATRKDSPKLLALVNEFARTRHIHPRPLYAYRMRLDKRLREAHPDLSWRQVREAVEKGQVTVDGQVQRDTGLGVSLSASISLDRNRPAQSTVRANFVILHEDEHILVLNKPAGLLSIPSSPAAGQSEDTVLRRVREYMALKRGHKTYVGMLHRLDRDTSGALAVALSKDAHAAGRELFKHHKFERHYLALVQGVPDPPSGTIEARISSGYRSGRRKLVDDEDDGLDATTDYLVKEKLMGAALLELRLHTGRQHQIRLHLEKLGHPLIGERVYSGDEHSAKPLARQALKPSSPRAHQASAKRNMLHAWTLAFPHPLTTARISVDAPLPADFEKLLAGLRRGRSR